MTHTDFHPYPDSVIAELQYLAGILLGGEEPETGCVVHAGANVLSFAASQVFPDVHEAGAPPPKPPRPPLYGVENMSKEDQAKTLQAAANPEGMRSTPDTSAVNWNLIIQIVIMLLQRFVKPVPEVV